MNFINPQPNRITEADLNTAADRLDCDVAIVKAVAEVEAGPFGAFFSSGRPVILFESRLFNKYTGGAFLNHPVSDAYNLATTDWQQNYWGGEKEYERLEAAIKLSTSPSVQNAALRACSWGLYQILGNNAVDLGYGDATTFVKEMVDLGARSHLEAFVRFNIENRLQRFLIAEDFESYSRYYNGPGFRKHDYDERLKKAVARFRRGDILGDKAGLRTTEALQRALLLAGFDPGMIDGIMGSNSIQALRAFQKSKGLKVDGMAGPKTWQALDNG